MRLRRPISSLGEGLLVLLGQILAVLGMLVGVRMLTEFLPPVMYGELALGLTLATLLSQTVFGPLANGAMRFYAPAVEKASLPSYLDATWRLSRHALAIVGAVLATVWLGLIIFGHAEWSLLALGALVYTAMSGLSAVLSGIQNAARKRAVVAFHQTLDSWLRIAITVGLLMAYGSSSSSAMLGYALAATVVLGSQWLFYRRLVGASPRGARPDSTWAREIWHYTWPFSAWGIFTWAQLVSDRWAIEWFASRQDVGYFGVLNQFGYGPIQLATGIAVQFVAPILFQRVGDGGDPARNSDVSRLSRTLTSIVLVVTAIGFAGTFALHAQLFRIFIAAEYAKVSYLLPWVVLAGGIFAAAQSVTLHLMSQLRVRVMLTAKIATALLGIVLNLVGARFYGITGVVAASVVFSTACLVWMLFLARTGGIAPTGPRGQ